MKPINVDSLETFELTSKTSEDGARCGVASPRSF